MKFARYVLYFILFCVLLRACGAITLHDHEWQDATCTSAKTCSICGGTDGKPLGHHWAEATCTAPKTCTICGETSGGPVKHDWVKATCETPKTCSVCGKTDGDPLGHYPSFLSSDRQIIRFATCQVEGIEAYPCIRCDALVESTFPKAAHTYGEWQIIQDATFDAPGKKACYCTECGEELETQEIPKKIDLTGGNGNNSSGNGNNFNSHNNPEQQNTTASYVLNTNTMKFHKPSCRDVPKIAAHNYATSSRTRSYLISIGYSPCGHCHP